MTLFQMWKLVIITIIVEVITATMICDEKNAQIFQIPGPIDCSGEQQVAFNTTL